ASGNQWFLNGNPIGGQTNQTYSATASGSYTVTVTTTGCTSSPSAATVVTVNPNPNATITAPASVVKSSTGNIASVANAGAGATYVWGITNGTITAGTGTASITFTAGAVGTLTLNVTVTTSANCSDAKSANVNVVLPTVTVTSVSPNSGTVTGGTNVTVNGTNFAAGATVTFGGTAATNVVVVSAIKITAKTPAHAAGAVNVTVTNADTSTATLTSGYTYTAQHFDPNNDGTIDPSDIFFLINYLFMNGPPPHGAGGLLSGDANGDGVVDPADIFYLVNYLFLGGSTPNRPAGSIGTSPITTSAVGAEVPHIAGSIALGKPALRGGHYVVPVVMTMKPGSVVPQAMSLRVHLDSVSTIGAVTVQRAGAAKDVPAVFETTRRSGNDVSYLVAYDPRGLAIGGARSAVIAEIEIDSAEDGVAITVDPILTMLSDLAGTMKATVGNQNLQVSGTTTGSGAVPRPHVPGHEVK
ncbi:MAG TPA: IPT/TIG domain-containing protein, partial [Thermoanaerobaculia bacterium]|nr:IPT/TIG domain-containing protein [Thermoanaerobaculia bacterium]